MPCKAPQCDKTVTDQPLRTFPGKRGSGCLRPGPPACLDLVTVNVFSALPISPPRTRKRQREKENPLVLAEMRNYVPRLRRSVGRRAEAPQRRVHPHHEAWGAP